MTHRVKSETIASFTPRRLTFLLGAFFVLAVMLVGRLGWLQVVHGQEYRQIAYQQNFFEGVVTTPRGTIYVTDKEGEEYIIATDETFYILYSVNQQIENDYQTATALAQIVELGMTPDQILSKFQNKDLLYKVIAKKIDSDTKKKIEALGLTGIKFEETLARVYPERDLASHITGFVGEDADGTMAGRYGIESYYDSILRGLDGYQKRNVNPRGGIIQIEDAFESNGQPGSDILLTIDRTIQHFVKEELHKAMTFHQTDYGAVVVMDVRTGEILAMASAPTYDPNKFNEIEDLAVFNNYALQPYEVGSIAKLFPIAAGLDLGTLTPETPYHDTGAVELGGFTIRNAADKSYGDVTATVCLQNSINTCMTKIALEDVGNEEMLKYYHDKFMFGELVGLELAGEKTGDIRPIQGLRDVNIATASFGQGFTASLVQMTSAYAAIANDGLMMKPQIVRAIRSPQGEYTYHEPEPLVQSVSKEAAHTAMAMLTAVVEGPHGARARLETHYTAGKTGTASVPKPGGGYYDNITIGSFVQVAPAADPRYAVGVMLYNPKTVQWAESSAAPLAKEVTEFLMNYYEIEADK